MRLLLVLLLLVGTASAQAGPEVVVVVHHPYPDDADPLGVPFGNDCSLPCDAFVIRHGSRSPFNDGIAFPGFIADGQTAMESLAEGDDVFQATLDAYEQAVQERLQVDTPIGLRIASRVVEGEVRLSFWISTQSPVGDGLEAWIALVEDPVEYRPPPALSNGVFEHPFTLRTIQLVGDVTISPAAEQRMDVVVPLDDDWDPAAMRVALWIEQDSQALGTFAPGEVVQATSHPLTAEIATVQTTRAVLVEAYSASWCEPCLIGDEALEELAEAHGLPTGRSFSDDAPSYLRQPPSMILVIAAAVISAALLAGSRLGAR